MYVCLPNLSVNANTLSVRISIVYLSQFMRLLKDSDFTLSVRTMRAKV